MARVTQNALNARLKGRPLTKATLTSATTGDFTKALRRHHQTQEPPYGLVIAYNSFVMALSERSREAARKCRNGTFAESTLSFAVVSKFSCKGRVEASRRRQETAGGEAHFYKWTEPRAAHSAKVADCGLRGLRRDIFLRQIIHKNLIALEHINEINKCIFIC
ncbi:unnamed protein product, partial [Iphiclides podalirius]